MKTKTVMLILLGIGILNSCFPPKVITAPEVVPEKVITYDYKPPQTNTDKVDLSFILLNPRYAEVLAWSRQDMFTKFINSMGDDFEEMLVAKGYSIRGPYDEYDEIVFSDKNETDLLLETSIDLSYEWGSNAVKYKQGYQGTYLKYPNEYWIDGNLHLGGKINLTIKESITQEKLWKKSIALSDKQIPIITGKHKATSRAAGVAMVMNDVRYKNAIYVALDEYYNKALTTAWNHLEPQELEALKIQVKELRKRKGY